MTFDFDSGHRFGILASRCIRMHGQILEKRNLKIWQKSKISAADISKTVENFSSATSASHISLIRSIHTQNFRKKSRSISEKSQKIDFWPRFWPWPRFRKRCPDPPSLVHMLLIDIWVEFQLLLVAKKKCSKTIITRWLKLSKAQFQEASVDLAHKSWITVVIWNDICKLRRWPNCSH